ncbi:3-methyladenine DNA glycosylase [Helicobacter suis]|uniref:3-methyladenine DNA glycosylase n=1 Tax=Helicobacter suis TaxID=104628 RepID=UPI001596917E|nr:3-methyladenine DNA glycosylase [Helicobacter suis]BCD48736.1 3-methyladenine DNA glycosylase MagIII [Helicobacter suis]
MLSSLEILRALKNLDLLKNAPALWWPSAGEFEVILGAILTQNTRFKQVLKSLENLKLAGILSADSNASLHDLATISIEKLIPHIVPSGFYRQKARYVCLLSQNILRDFQDFKTFQKQVNREWLLKQLGIGPESADAILNYACLRPVMVVDRYTYQFLLSLGLDIKDYGMLQKFFMQGITNNLDKVLALYEYKLDLAAIYARFHGKIVEYMRASAKPQLKEFQWSLLMPV